MRLSLALFIAATRFCLVAQTEESISDPKGPNTLQSLALAGPVRLVKETHIAQVSESEPEGSILRIKTFRFSPEGRLLEVDDCDTENTCDDTRLVWDSRWVIEERRTSELIDEVTKYLRDGEGRPVKEVQVEDYFNGYGSRHEIRYEYEPLSTVRTKLIDDLPFEKRISSEDAENSIERASVYLRTKQLNGKMVWALEGSHFSQSERFIDGSIRISSDNGRSISAFDAHGRQTEDTIDTPNYYNRTVYVYNDQGWLVERSEYNRDETQINSRKYTYQADSHGNWIRKTEDFGSSAMETSIEGDVVIRDIAYF